MLEENEKILLRIMSMLEELILQQGNDIMKLNERIKLLEQKAQINYAYKEIKTYNDEVY